MQIERVSRLKRFLSPQIADLILSSSPYEPLASHRRQVTIVFGDLRGFTAFAEVAEPEEVMAVMREYHSALGSLVHEFEGTLERFLGDGIMVIFGIRFLVPIRAGELFKWRSRCEAVCWNCRRSGGVKDTNLVLESALHMDMRRSALLVSRAAREYSAIGTVVNLAARLCAEARDGQILVDSKVREALDERATAEPLGELTLKGLRRPIAAYNVIEVA